MSISPSRFLRPTRFRRRQTATPTSSENRGNGTCRRGHPGPPQRRCNRSGAAGRRFFWRGPVDRSPGGHRECGARDLVRCRRDSAVQRRRTTGRYHFGGCTSASGKRVGRAICFESHESTVVGTLRLVLFQLAPAARPGADRFSLSRCLEFHPALKLTVDKIENAQQPFSDSVRLGLVQHLIILTARISAHIPAPSTKPVRSPIPEGLRRSGTLTKSSRRGWRIAPRRDSIVSPEAWTNGLDSLTRSGHGGSGAW
jgi:hypothetical protein